MEPLRVLVVDDHDEFRQGLEALLGSDADGRGGRQRRRRAHAPSTSPWTSSPTSS